MKSLRSPGLRGILGLSALLFVCVLPLSSGSEPASLPDRPVNVFMKQGGCTTTSLDATVLTDVRAVVEAALAAAPDISRVASIQDALELAYPCEMVQTAAPIQYKYVLINGIWFRVCFDEAVFEIDFGFQGTVVVSAADSMPVPRLE